MYERRMGKAMTVVFVTYFYVKPSSSSGAKILQTIYGERKWLLPSCE